MKTLNPLTEADLHCIGMESDTAYRLMPQLCKLLGYQFPPRMDKPANERRDAIPCPFAESAA